MDNPWVKFFPERIKRRIQGRSEVQTILGNISWLSVDRVVRMGVGLVVGVWVARYLGPDQYGLLSFAVAFVSLFSPLTHLGLDYIVVREIVQRPEETHSTLGTATILRLVGAAVSGLGAIVIIVVTQPTQGLTHALVAIAAAAVLFQAVDTIDFWYQSQVRAKYVVYARNGAFLVISCVKVGMILLHAPLIAFAWAAFGELGLSAAGLLIIYRRDGQQLSLWTAAASRARKLFKDSWPLFLSGVSVAIYMRIDQVMIGYILDDAAVGTYSVAIRLVEIWYFIPTAIANSVLPALIRARNQDESLYNVRLQKFYDVMGMVGLAIAGLTSLLSTPIISLLYGQKYVAAGPILAVYAWASVPVFLGVASSQYFLVENKTRISLYRTFAGVVVNVLLNLVMIPAYGPIGAAIASLVSNIVVTFSIALMPGSGRQVLMLLRSMNVFRTLKGFVLQG